jgi:hypothetical protein
MSIVSSKQIRFPRGKGLLLMRRRNLLRYPLNAVLATEAHVKVLRALFAHGGELTPPAIAARTDLTRQGTRNVLSTLVKTGFVLEKGLGRYKHYMAATSHFHLRLSVMGLSDDDVTRLSKGDAWWVGVQVDARALVGPGPEVYARQVRRRADGGEA